MLRVPSSTEIARILPAGDALPAQAPPPAGEPSFEDLLARAVQDVNATNRSAAAQVEALAAGAIDDVHGTMIAVKEAEIGMKLVGSVRNKLLDAFHEIWRTSV